MQILRPSSHPTQGRVGFLVPRWTVDPIASCQGVPFRCLPVAGALVAAGFEVVFFDQEPDLDRHDSSLELRESLHDALTTFIWMNELDPMIQSHNALALATRLKSWYPDLPVVVGGAFISIVPPEGLRTEVPVDYFLRGPGERACAAFVLALRDGTSLALVPGLVWNHGELRHNEPDPAVKPIWEHYDVYRQLDLTAYVQSGGIFGNAEATLVIALANGCSKGCGFCYWRDFKPGWLGAEQLVDLVAYLRDRYGVHQYHIAELDFAASRQRVFAVARLWAERVPDCTWFALVSPIDAARFTEAEWDALAAGGCRKLELGTESGSRRVLSAIGKKHAPEDAVAITERMLRQGIVPMHNFVFGTPGEQRSDRQRTLRLIRRLQAMSPWVAFTFRFFQPAWNTPLGETAMARSPGYPRHLREILAHRPFLGDMHTRAMEWLSAADERTIKVMVLHYLPLTISRATFVRRTSRWAHFALRAVARQRTRLGWFSAGVDRWLFARLVRVDLDCTFTP